MSDRSEHAARYRAANRKQQRKLNKWTAITDYAGLRGELAALRLTLDNLLQSPNASPSLIGQITLAIAKVAQTCQDLDRERGALLDATVARQMADRMVEATVCVLRDECPNLDLERVADRIIERFAVMQSEAESHE
jgi:hypothetical protein